MSYSAPCLYERRGHVSESWQLAVTYPQLSRRTQSARLSVLLAAALLPEQQPAQTGPPYLLPPSTSNPRHLLHKEASMAIEDMPVLNDTPMNDDFADDAEYDFEDKEGVEKDLSVRVAR